MTTVSFNAWCTGEGDERASVLELRGGSGGPTRLSVQSIGQWSNVTVHTGTHPVQVAVPPGAAVTLFVEFMGYCSLSTIEGTVNGYLVPV